MRKSLLITCLFLTCIGICSYAGNKISDNNLNPYFDKLYVQIDNVSWRQTFYVKYRTGEAQKLRHDFISVQCTNPHIVFDGQIEYISDYITLSKNPDLSKPNIYHVMAIVYKDKKGKLQASSSFQTSADLKESNFNLPIVTYPCLKNKTLFNDSALGMHVALFWHIESKNTARHL